MELEYTHLMSEFVRLFKAGEAPTLTAGDFRPRSGEGRPIPHLLRHNSKQQASTRLVLNGIRYKLLTTRKNLPHSSYIKSNSSIKLLSIIKNRTLY